MPYFAWTRRTDRSIYVGFVSFHAKEIIASTSQATCVCACIPTIHDSSNREQKRKRERYKKTHILRLNCTVFGQALPYMNSLKFNRN